MTHSYLYEVDDIHHLEDDLATSALEQGKVIEVGQKIRTKILKN